MPYTLEDWKRTPTTATALFGINLPLRPPKNSLGAFLWRRRVWIETTTGISLLEPWEKILILTIFYLLLTIIITGFYKYLPQQIYGLEQRMIYYLLGAEADKGVAVPRFVAGLVGNNSTREL